MKTVRRVIGFLPLVFWLFMLYLGGCGTAETARDTWSIAAVPKTLWIWSALSLSSGIMLCFESLTVCGLVLGAIPSVYLLLGVIGSRNIAVICIPALMVIFYTVYALLCYFAGDRWKL